MGLLFNVDEVFQVAIEIERNGETFYRRAAERVQDKKVKDTLGRLASLEKDHEALFASLKRQLTTAEKEETTFDPAGEAAAYLKALADTRVFFRKEIDMSSPEEVLKAAILAEKDSIAFYLGMKEMIQGQTGKSRMDEIIREEMQHVRLLGNELMGLKAA
jgi:rubrerythrin